MAGRKSTSTRPQRSNLWPVVLLLALELAMGAVLVEKLLPEPEPPNPEAPALLITSEAADDVDFVQGAVMIQLQNHGAAGVTFWLEPENGKAIALASNRTSHAWDSTQATNGPYRIAARDATGLVAAAKINVQNARQQLDTTAAAVGASTAVAAGGSAIGSSLASRAALTAAQIGKESLMAVGEDRIAMRAKKRRRRQISSRLAFGLIILLVLIFFSFEEIDSYRVKEILAAIPIAGGVAAIFVAMALGAEYLLGWASRAKTGVRFLSSGAVSLAVSSIVFRTPFGVPGFVEEIGDEGAGGVEAGESSDDEAPHVEGIRAMASMGVLLTLLMPFLAIGYAWNYKIAEQGLEIALIALATSALPIKPLPGYDIWSWRKAVAIPFAVAAFLLYFGFALAFLPAGIIFQLGIVAAIYYAGAFTWLRARSAEPQPEWYPKVAHQWELMLADIRRLIPAFGRNAAHAIERGVNATVKWLGRAAASAVLPYVAIESKRRERALRKELQAEAAARATDLSQIMDELDGLDDEAEYTVVDADGNATVRRVGDLREEAIRTRLYAEFGKNAPGTVTLVDGESARVMDLD